jgi:hypothetical protein
MGVFLVAHFLYVIVGGWLVGRKQQKGARHSDTHL